MAEIKITTYEQDRLYFFVDQVTQTFSGLVATKSPIGCRFPNHRKLKAVKLMRDRLSKLINQSNILCDTCGESTSSYCAEAIADYLIKSGVIVPPCKVGDITYIFDYEANKKKQYIDADKLIAHLKDEIEGCKPPFCGRANGKSIAYGTILGLKSAISFAETLSTADVVPKSEVARLQEDVDRLNEINEGLVRELSELRKQIELDKLYQEIDKNVRRRLGDFL